MKSTKKALAVSILSMMLCVTMLLGTTYAWFTDSVTSGKNVIKAGNLDIKLEYSTDLSSWTEMTENTDVFAGSLWEPGFTEVVYLKVSNVGTLSLKYNLGINVAKETKGTNTAGDEFKLSDYIMFGTETDVEEAYADRAAAVSAVSANAKAISTGYTASGNMSAGDTKVVALVVYMPDTVGDAANYRGTKPEIELGIEVLAAQFTKETDMFGDQYDKDATYPTPIVPKDPVEYDDTNHIATINSADGYIAYATGDNSGYAAVLGGDIDFGGQTIPTMTLTSLDGQGYTIKNAKATNALFTGYDEGTLGTVKNLTLDNITITGAADGWNNIGIFGSETVSRQATFTDVTVKNSTVTTDGTKAEYVGILLGNVAFSTFTNCKVIGCEVTAVKNAGALIGMAQTYGDDTTLTNCSAENCTIHILTTRNTIGQLVGRAITPEGGVITLTDCSATSVSLYNNGVAVDVPTLVGDTGEIYTNVTVNGESYVK